MQFPDGGPLTRSLWFDPIDKDAMCVKWKGLYRTHNVPAQVGVEMLGLERSGQIWRVKCWNHNTKADQVYQAKHVILAMGRGVPRRIDIAGDLRGMAFNFKDAVGYLGQPALVIGGSQSAAEAVIAISNAKATAGETAAVYWSYRADKMPKVSKALAEVFFEAFVINGNVRYLPSSEPVAIVGDGPGARLAIRTVRKETPGQPVETTHLEFDKTFCLACIGEDIPEQLLAAIGAPLVTGGPQNKKRIIVTPLLETRQPNVYLAGDVLSPAYFETTTFDGDPAQFPEIKRRGNVKAAMRDGVFLAEVIAQKIAGKSEIRVDLKFADAPPSPAATPGPTEDAKASSPNPAPVAPPAPTPAPVPPTRVAPPKSDHVLISVLPTGVEANEYGLKPSGATSIGRAGADVAFPDDAALSDRHAAIDAGSGGYHARPEAGARGFYLLPPPDRAVPLEPGMLIHAGRQWFVAGDRHDPDVAHPLRVQRPVAAAPDAQGRRDDHRARIAGHHGRAERLGALPTPLRDHPPGRHARREGPRQRQRHADSDRSAGRARARRHAGPRPAEAEVLRRARRHGTEGHGAVRSADGASRRRGTRSARQREARGGTDDCGTRAGPVTRGARLRRPRRLRLRPHRPPPAARPSRSRSSAKWRRARRASRSAKPPRPRTSSSTPTAIRACAAWIR